MPKIVTLCGMGWGCALMLKMNIMDIFEKHNIKGFDVEACDLASAKSAGGDMIVGTADMKKHVADAKVKKIVLVESLTDKKELEDKILAAIKDLK